MLCLPTHIQMAPFAWQKKHPQALPLHTLSLMPDALILCEPHGMRHMGNMLILQGMSIMSQVSHRE